MTTARAIDLGNLTVNVGKVDHTCHLFINGVHVKQLSSNTNFTVGAKEGDAVNFVSQYSGRPKFMSWTLAGTGISNIIRDHFPNTCACILREQSPVINVSYIKQDITWNHIYDLYNSWDSVGLENNTWNDLG